VKRQDARDAKTLEEPAKELDEHVSDLLAAASEVHRILGPGFLESVYDLRGAGTDSLAAFASESFSRLSWRPGVPALK